MNGTYSSAALAARIYSALPIAQTAFSRLLRLLAIEATDKVPTAAVTLGEQSRLLLNPVFVRQMCPTDDDLVMLVLHELHHVALGHTRLFPRLTPAQNWAFDCVINAQLCRLYPQPHKTALFRRCYRAHVAPEALLRPPEGWGTSAVRWLPGAGGEMHRALYSDDSVTYTDLYRLLPTMLLRAAGDGAEPDRGSARDDEVLTGIADRLLGDHEGDEPSDISPDVLREMRDILAEWPMVEQISGRDAGGDLQSSRVRRAQAIRETARVLRKAILSIADLGAGCRGGIERKDEERDSVLPYVLRPHRADTVRQALGIATLLHPERLMTSGLVRREAVHVYFDVSGSMEDVLPALYATLASLSDLLHPQVHLFSTQIDDIDVRQLAQGVRCTTGGTSIHPVTQHAIDHRVRRALFITDGWVGKVRDEHALTLGRRGTRFAAAITHCGDANFAATLNARAWRLPVMEEAS